MKASELKPFYYKTFRIEELQNYFKQQAPIVRTQLSRLCKKKQLIRLKRNCYTFPDFHPSAFVIGQAMVSPSYYSLESVLAMNGIIPEGAATYTLVTSEKTQQYTNAFGMFSFRHLPPHLFFGVIKRADGIWMATSEKALLDYLYLYSKKFKPNFRLWQEERFDELETLNWKHMVEWAAKYRMKKLNILVKNLKQYAQSEAYQSHK